MLSLTRGRSGLPTIEDIIASSADCKSLTTLLSASDADHSMKALLKLGSSCLFRENCEAWTVACSLCCACSMTGIITWHWRCRAFSMSKEMLHCVL